MSPWTNVASPVNALKPARVHMLARKGGVAPYPFFLTSLTLVNSMPSARSLV